MDSMYKRLLVVLGINAVLMFFITYANLWELGHYHANVNRVYMALMMTAPMGIVMMLVMGSMFENRRLTGLFITGFIVLFIAAYALTRVQAPVGDDQFLRSMIPHHSTAVLVCERSEITDPEISELCDQIVRTQLEEIAQMEAILERR